MPNPSPKQEPEKQLIWPPEMNGDPLTLVLDQLAQFNTSHRICMYDEAQGVPCMTSTARHALALCSAVCRAWRFPAQNRLLHSIELYSKAGAAKVTAGLIIGGWSTIPRHVTLHLPLSPSHSVNAIAPITDLQSLVMKSLYPKVNPIDTTEICTLMLERCTFLANITSFHHLIRGDIPFEILARILVAMPKLKDLTLDLAGTSYSKCSHIPRPTFNLQYLELWDDGSLSGQFNLHDWLFRSSGDSLEMLTLCSERLNRDQRPFMDAFTVIAPSLKSLRVPYPDDQSPISAMISQCTSLVELGLHRLCFRVNAASIFASFPPALRCLRIGDIHSESGRYREMAKFPAQFDVFTEAITRSLLPSSLTTIIIDVKEAEAFRGSKSVMADMARACNPKGVTVWIACPSEQCNLSELIEKQPPSQTISLLDFLDWM